MKVILHDLDRAADAALREKGDEVIAADGKYAPCQGCFGCWLKHPAECEMKDSLHRVCRLLGRADELVIITKGCYGGYSPAVKNVIDRSIGTSTPLSTYRSGEMHHTLRYDKGKQLTVLGYGDFTAQEKETFRHLAERNAINFGYLSVQVSFFRDSAELEAAL